MQRLQHDAHSATTLPAITDSQGAVRIAKHVLDSIIELAIMEVEGVARLAPVSSPWPRLLRAEPQRGIATNVRGKTLSVDLYIILRPGVPMAQVGHAVQEAVAKSIEDILGLTPGEINVYIQDIA